MMARNRPRIKPATNSRMDNGAFVYSWSIRGWSLGAAKVNALRGLQSAGGEELRRDLTGFRETFPDPHRCPCMGCDGLALC